MKPVHAVSMGMVGGVLALTVALSPAHADSGHPGAGTSTHQGARAAAAKSGTAATEHHHARKTKKRADHFASTGTDSTAPVAATAASTGTASATESTKKARTAERSAAHKRTAAGAAGTTTAAAATTDTTAKGKAKHKAKAADTVAADAAQTKDSFTPARAAADPGKGTGIAESASATTAVQSAAAVQTAAAASVTDSTTTTTTTTTTSTSAKATAHPTLLNFFGSLLFNALGVVMQLFAGNPVLPKGSTTTVKVSTLVMPDTGQKVVADWYFPENVDSSTRIIYFQHGFMAVASMYSYTLAALAEQTNSIVVAPTLSSNAFDVNARWLGGSADQHAVADLFVGDRAALTASARAAGFEGTLPTDVVLAGHSLGGGLVTAAAGYMVDNGAAADLKGVLLMDAVDLNNVVPTALAKLTGDYDIPVYDISSEPYVWNRDGLVGQELAAARPDRFTGVMLEGGRHIDALQGPNPILQWGEYLIAGTSSAKNIAAEKTLAIGWINDMFAGTTDGIYGSPQQSIEIPTTAGTATAIALPFTSTTPIQATPLDGIANVILNTVLQYAVYEPMVGAAAAASVTISA